MIIIVPLIVALCAVVLVSLSDCGGFYIGDTYANSEAYHCGNFTYKGESIEAVEIHWALGTIELVSSAEAHLQVSEKGGNLRDTQRLHWIQEGKTLKIQFCASGYHGKIDRAAKNITVELPNSIDVRVNNHSASLKAPFIKTREIIVSSASGAVEMTELLAEEARFSLQSGSLHIDALTVQNNVSMDTASGSIKIGALKADTASIDSKSGKIGVTSVNVAKTLNVLNHSGATHIRNLETGKLTVSCESGHVTLGILACNGGDIAAKSGNVTLSLLNDFGAKIAFSSRSGRLKTDRIYVVSGDMITFNSGAAYFQIDTTSGDLFVS